MTYIVIALWWALSLAAATAVGFVVGRAWGWHRALTVLREEAPGARIIGKIE